MTITLNPEVQRFVEGKVRAGQFLSLDDAVNALLSQVRDQDELSPDDIAELRSEVDIGLAQLDRGEVADFTAEQIISERRAALAPRQKGG